VLLVDFLWVRFMAAVVVRSSIRKGCNICLHLLSNRRVDAVVGFSWGGAVVAELLATSEAQEPALLIPPVLLIAPTTAAVAAVALQQDAALRSSPNRSRRLHVIHASNDEFFCPHQDRWHQISRERTSGTSEGTEAYTFSLLNDNHIFVKRSSKQAILQAMRQLVENTRISSSGMGKPKQCNILDMATKVTPVLSVE
jgi:dienelactone hydrolase